MKKSLRRAIQRKLLNEALDAVYHNGSVHYFKDVPKKYEMAAQEALELQWEEDLREINDDVFGEEGYIEHDVAEKYGKVLHYGRSGATIAPKSWMMADSHVKRPENFELSYGNIWALIADINAFNALIEGFVSAAYIDTVLDPWLEERLYEDAREAKKYARLLTV